MYIFLIPSEHHLGNSWRKKIRWRKKQAVAEIVAVYDNEWLKFQVKHYTSVSESATGAL